MNVGKLCLNVDMLNAFLCVLGGTLGSGVSALISAADRISHDWEFQDGTKYPTDETEDKFGQRMVPWFIVRPFLRSAMGLLVYVGITGGYLIAVQKGTSAGAFSREGLLFLAFLGGLFAKPFSKSSGRRLMSCLEERKRNRKAMLHILSRRNNTEAKTSCVGFTNLESPIRVPERPSAFPPRGRQNAFRCRGARQQSRLFVRWNQSLRYSPSSRRLCCHCQR